MNTLDEIFDKYDTIICLDTETTGLDELKCQIIDLGVIEIKRINGKLVETSSINDLIKLNDPEAKLPTDIINLTHITDEMLKSNGLPISEVKEKFTSLLNKPGKKIIATYNAQFDLKFLRHFLKGCKLSDIVFLDIMTVYKDRVSYPHKLCEAINHYDLNDIVVNSHRALDDTRACFEVLKCMSDEKHDIDKYINLFGYNAKFGLPNPQIKNVVYKPQSNTANLKYPLYNK